MPSNIDGPYEDVRPVLLFDNLPKCWEPPDMANPAARTQELDELVFFVCSGLVTRAQTFDHRIEHLIPGCG